MTENETQLLNHLDKPAKLFGLPYDELGVFVLPFMGGMMTDWMMFGFILSFSGVFFLRTLKKKNEGISLHALTYWHLGLGSQGMSIPIPSHVREWMG